MKGLKITLIAILCGLIVTLGVGMLLVMSGKAGVGGFFGGFQFNNDNTWGSCTLQKTEEFDIGDISCLRVNSERSVADVFIKPTEKEKIILEEYYSSQMLENEFAKIQQSSEKLEIIPNQQNKQWSIVGFSGNYGYIVLYVPVKIFGQLKELQLNTSSGDIIIEEFSELEEKGLLLDTAQIASTSGDIMIDYLNSQNIQITSTSGDVSLREAEGNLMISSTSGDQLVNKAEGDVSMMSTSGALTADSVIGELVMEATSGDINVDQLSGKGAFTTASGEIYVKARELVESLAMSASSGDISLTVPAESEFELEIATSSGDIRTSYDKYLSYNEKGNYAAGVVGKGSDIKIKIKTSSGEVVLR